MTPTTPTYRATVDNGCCLAQRTAPSPRLTAALMEARSIADSLAVVAGLDHGAISAAYTDHGAAVHVMTQRGLVTLRIPPIGRPFDIYIGDELKGAITAKRGRNTASRAAAQFALWLHTRHAL